MTKYLAVALIVIVAAGASYGARLHTPQKAVPKPASHKAVVKPNIPTARELYLVSRQAEWLCTYRGRMATTYWITGRAVAVQISHKASSWERIEYLSPERLRGIALLSDGKQQWQFTPSTKTLTISRTTNEQPFLADPDSGFNLLTHNYDLTFSPQPQIFDDRKTFVLSIVRRSNHTLARKLWIDAATDIILKREAYQISGRLATTAAYTEVDFHPNFPAATFTLPGMSGEKGIRIVNTLRGSETPIALVTVSRQLTNTAVVPMGAAGYELIGAGLIPYKGRTALHLRYSDGLNLVSVFETQRMLRAKHTRVPVAMRPVRIAGVDAHVTHRGALTTINWDTSRLNITLMGETAENTLEQFVQSIGVR